MSANKTKTITCRPNWVSTAQMLITILEGSSSFTDKKWAREEIVRMGKIIDAYATGDSEEALNLTHDALLKLLNPELDLS